MLPTLSYPTRRSLAIGALPSAAPATHHLLEVPGVMRTMARPRHSLEVNAAAKAAQQPQV